MMRSNLMLIMVSTSELLHTNVHDNSLQKGSKLNWPWFSVPKSIYTLSFPLTVGMGTQELFICEALPNPYRFIHHFWCLPNSLLFSYHLLKIRHVPLHKPLIENGNPFTYQQRGYYSWVPTLLCTPSCELSTLLKTYSLKSTPFGRNLPYGPPQGVVNEKILRIQIATFHLKFMLIIFKCCICHRQETLLAFHLRKRSCFFQGKSCDGKISS